MFDLFSTRETGGFGSNLIIAVTAQGVALVSSVLTSLALPKLLGVDDYAYWQLFMLYSSYVGFALLGLNDGIYLRLGGKHYDDLDFGELKGQQFLVVVSQVVIALVCLLAVWFAGFSGERMIVFVFVVVFGILSNLTQCLRYVFQSTNLTRISSVADLASKGLFIICLGTLLLVGADNFLPYVACYVACQSVALLYVAICARHILGARVKLRSAISTCLVDIKSGMQIMLAYYADSLVIGFTRMLTDARLGLAVFGKLSLAFSLTNFALTFIGQVAMVAFPMLKRLDLSQRREKYVYIRRILHIVLPLIYLAYVPMRYILVLWLPNYADSLVYLALTMPLCIYSCKANLLFNTYLKIYRDETKLCVINVLTMLLNGALSLALIESVGVVGATVGIVISLAVRDFIFERHMDSRIHAGYVRSCLLQGLLAAGFMAASWHLGAWSIVAVLAMVLVFWAAQREDSLIVANDLAGRIHAKLG